MTPAAAILWLATIVFDTFGQLAFKSAATSESSASGVAYWVALLRNKWVLAGIGCFIGEFITWLCFLSLVDLGEGVLLGSINIVAVMLAGRWFFHEKLTRMRVIGIGLVAIGVIVVGVGA